MRGGGKTGEAPDKIARRSAILAGSTSLMQSVAHYVILIDEGYLHKLIFHISNKDAF